MYKIIIEEEWNPNSKYIGKWFVGYDLNKRGPIFTDNEEEAGVFVDNMHAHNAVYGNLMALYGQYGIKGTPIPLPLPISDEE